MSDVSRGFSPLASRLGRLRDVRDRAHYPPEALLVHTTGRGVYDHIEHGISPLQHVLDEYATPGNNFPHYVIDLEGGIHQVANDTEEAWHCAHSTANAGSYKDGSWLKRVSPVGRSLWKGRWDPGLPSRRSPLDLVSDRPNAVCLGVELVPRLEAFGGLLFTDEQHDAVAALHKDIAERWQVALKLLGHEDLSPLDRWDQRGGWDPGSLRPAPLFDWLRVHPSARHLDLKGSVPTGELVPGAAPVRFG